jgi:hypothetical protein
MCRFQDKFPHERFSNAGDLRRHGLFFQCKRYPERTCGGLMLFSRLAITVFALLSPCLSDTLGVPASESPCPKDADWCRLERLPEFPPRFSGRFVDSLQTARGAVPVLSRRSLPREPFANGEKFVFDVSWGPITAGYAILEAAPDSAGSTLVLSAKGMTNGFFSSMYKVRDYIRATMDMDGIYPFFFEQHLREGRYKADRWEMFDQDKNTVYTHKKDADSVAVTAFVQNYFSMIYWVRALSFAPGDSFSFDCFVDKKSHRQIGRASCRERVYVQV